MLIGDKYKIEADSMNVILSEKKITKKGEETWENIGYFSSLPPALKFMVDHDINGVGFTDLAIVNDRITELYELIHKLVKAKTEIVPLNATGAARSRVK